MVNRGYLLCGVNPGLPGFSAPDEKGDWSGFDVDFCRALAAAIFNDTSKVKYIPLDASLRFKELRDRNIDVLSRNSTWSMSRETEYGLHFAGVSYYDGQGFMTKKARNIDNALALDGSKVCVQENTTTELNLSDYFKSNNMKFEQVIQQARRSAESLRRWQMRHHHERRLAALCATPEAHESGRQRHPARRDLEGAARAGGAPSRRPVADDREVDAVCTINAEELGITSKNLDEAMRSGKPEVQRFMGVSSDYGDDIGLTRDWASRIVRLVGNYGEVYDRNVGDQSKLGIPRGLNQLWDAGGIEYAPPNW